MGVGGGWGGGGGGGGGEEGGGGSPTLCGAICCSVLRCVVELQRVAVHGSVLQCDAVC